ncbi:MAG: hypothetical protein ACETWK_09325 [Candidatus Aminicenantaceae bacterium]
MREKKRKREIKRKKRNEKKNVERKRRKKILNSSAIYALPIAIQKEAIHGGFR